MNTNPTIIQYIYNKKIPSKNRRAIGVLAAVARGDAEKIHIGWSLCAKGRGDKFDKARGLQIALGRSLVGSTAEVPDSIAEQINCFSARACRYFKDREVSIENLPIPKKSVDSSKKIGLTIEVER